jgi:hypothetical protein
MLTEHLQSASPERYRYSILLGFRNVASGGFFFVDTEGVSWFVVSSVIMSSYLDLQL